MTLLNDEVRRYIGLSTGPIEASEPVEKGEVRRFAQAIMDEHPRYAEERPDDRFGAPIAPPLFPALMFRRPLGKPDPLLHAGDPDYDGLSLAKSHWASRFAAARKCACQRRCRGGILPLCPARRVRRPAICVSGHLRETIQSGRAVALHGDRQRVQNRKAGTVASL